MQISLKEIFTTYWSQTVLILAAIGFLIQRILTMRAKKVEEKERLFQQQRQAAIVDFVKKYIIVQTAYRKLISDMVYLPSTLDKDFVNALLDRIEDLYSAYYLFRIYLEPIESARYSDIMTSTQNIANKINEYYKGVTESKAHINEGDLKHLISEMLATNNNNFKEIGKIYRENVSKHYPVG